MSKSLRLQPSRLTYRATDDPERIRTILQTEKICTVSFQADGQVYALPTAFILYQDQLVIHGSVKSQFLERMLNQRVCITIFSLNGLVLAASAFHHSMNYASVVIFSKPTEIHSEEEKEACLKAFTDKIVPDRWEYLRPVSKGELQATRVLAFSLEKVSCKYREGGPSDDREDEHFPVWTGVVPLVKTTGQPQPAAGKENMEIPAHISTISG